MNEIYSTTTNGAVVLKTSGSNIVDLFMLLNRNIDKKLFNSYMKKCWKEDPLRTIAIIFNARDRNKGKKEKKLGNDGMLWLRKYKPETYKLNILNYINKYGRWKDLLYLTFYSYNMKIPINYELKIMAEQLKTDINNLNNNKKISLCAKWAPSQNDRLDKKRQITYRLANILFPDDKKCREKYRKQYLAPLRKHLKLVESFMCSNRWNEIKYEAVPGVASNRLKKAFMKHDEERYKKFIEDVKSGNKKINTTGLLPHELVKYYLDLKEKTSYRYNWFSSDEDIDENPNKEKYEINETIEVMWNKLVEDVKSTGNLEGLIPVSDISGSMYCNNNIPILVSISLGLLISQCNTGVFNNKIITFSSKPEIFEVKGDTLFDRFNSILKMDAGFDTNFEAVSDLLLSVAKMYRIPQENMIKKIVVLSDMQFNVASTSKDSTIETLHDYICNKYTTENYIPPDFIYWNLSSYDKSFPIESTKDGTAIISGFSEQLLKAFMKYDKITPELIVFDLLTPYLNEVILDENEKLDDIFSDTEEKEQITNKNDNDFDNDSISDVSSENETEEDVLRTLKEPPILVNLTL